jgi:hypothetical protein
VFREAGKVREKMPGACVTIHIAGSCNLWPSELTSKTMIFTERDFSILHE